MIASQMKSKRSSGAALKIGSVADPEMNGNNKSVPFLRSRMYAIDVDLTL